MPRTKKDTSAPKTPAKTSTKTSAKKNKQDVAAPVEKVVAPVENTVVETEAESGISSDFTKILASIQEITSKISSLKTELRSLEKRATRELKAANKKKRNVSKHPRTPSGFVKPTRISTELAAFLGKSEGTQMARTEVTKEINAYIRANHLQNKDNGRIINADAKLSALLKLKKGDELTYFNLQRYMSPHFPKATTA